MLLYHGSNISVTKPRIIPSNRALDFGPGFYLSSDEDQAIRWARAQTKRRGSGVPTVSVFELTNTATDAVKIKEFPSADIEWLRFVAENRKELYRGEKYDIISGPVANDNTMPVINDYMSGVIDEDTAIVLLKAQHLTDQYAFLTYKGLDKLKYMETHNV